MQASFDGATLVIALVTALWGICTTLVVAHAKRMRDDARRDREALEELQRALAKFREQVAKECVSRDEVKDDRQATREAIVRLEAKVDDLRNLLVQANVKQ
ncbi:hypothetical protein PCA31118_00024 [Pandoraea captiosa]|uniref:Uncharacterized protein n=1 Tax=Pandoraea captiosa TaxID=2508302 RepID=A0A5E4ZFC1_9BURK|nr:hypothetical protein [Pandoraea captiosa]VVE59814.1 hypothetical protein PCA31118_00024 [Pandoraea captiosa]